MNRQKVIYWHELPGHNFRLTNLQAALGVAQLNSIDVILKERRRVYTSYFKQLSDKDGIHIQKIENEVEPVIWAFALKLDSKAFPQGRDVVMKQMKKAGIETRPGFYCSSLLPIYEKHSLPLCEEISKNIISLPSFPTLKDEEIAFISEKLISLKK